MAKIEPGLYEPSDDPHAFDGGEDDFDDEGSRLPLLIVVALLVLAAFAGVVWFAYTQGEAHGRAGAPEVIAAQPGPVKTAPANPGGVSTPYRGLKIYEQPAPADDQAAAPATAAKTAQAATPPAAAAAKSGPAMAAKTAHPSTGTPPSSPVVKQATIRTAPVAPAKTAPTRTASTAAPQAAALSSAGAYTLQVGSFKSRADAEASWTQFHSRHAAVVGGASHTIREANLGPKGDWFRLQVGSFASRDAATAFCAKLKANGASCFPTK